MLHTKLSTKVFALATALAVSFCCISPAQALDIAPRVGFNSALRASSPENQSYPYELRLSISFLYEKGQDFVWASSPTDIGENYDRLTWENVSYWYLSNSEGTDQSNYFILPGNDTNRFVYIKLLNEDASPSTVKMIDLTKATDLNYSLASNFPMTTKVIPQSIVTNHVQATITLKLPDIESRTKLFEIKRGSNPEQDIQFIGAFSPNSFTFDTDPNNDINYIQEFRLFNTDNSGSAISLALDTVPLATPEEISNQPNLPDDEKRRLLSTKPYEQMYFVGAFSGYTNETRAVYLSQIKHSSIPVRAGVYQNGLRFRIPNPSN